MDAIADGAKVDVEVDAIADGGKVDVEVAAIVDDRRAKKADAIVDGRSLDRCGVNNSGAGPVLRERTTG